MSSTALSSTKPTNATTARDSFIPGGSNGGIHLAQGNLLQSKPRPTLTRHHAELQEHIDHLPIAEASPKDVVTPQYDTRRREFSWGSHPPTDDWTRNSRNRNPLPPERPGARTPPSLEKIIRSSTNDDADSVYKPRLLQGDTTSSQPSLARMSRSSTMSDAPSRTDTRKSSIVVFARGLARQIPDMRMFAPPPGIAADGLGRHSRRDSQNATFKLKSRRDSKPTFVPPSAMKTRSSHEGASKPTHVTIEPSSHPRANASTTQAPVTGSLRDRRRVKMDLSLPSDISDLPVRGRPPAGTSSSMTPSRPRSPRTPWTRSEPPSWELSKFPKSTPIIEEDYLQGGTRLRSGNEHITTSSSSPVFQRPPPKVRDRCYISHPRLKRGRSDRSGTSDSTLAWTPEDAWTPDDVKALQEQEARTNEELNQLGQISKTSRLWRWRWRGSSDEPLPSPESINRRSSINLFRRSARIAEDAGDTPDQTQSKPPPRPWRGKPAQLTHPVHSSLARMALPPTFVPPGVNRVPTPPMFDAQSEVRGKLADFFFDVHGEAARSQFHRTKASPGGFWDSDALLMSFPTDNADVEEEEEGPEGRAPYVHTQVDFETNGTPELPTKPGGYLGMSSVHTGAGVPSPVLRQDNWIHIQQGEATAERAFTALALKEEDERRKFEWLIPEHLPNSPLCPLHPIYRGPCKGLCYWHGQKTAASKKPGKNQAESGIDWTADGQWVDDDFEDKGKMRVEKGSRGWETGSKKALVQDRKKRRLASLSHP